MGSLMSIPGYMCTREPDSIRIWGNCSTGYSHFLSGFSQPLFMEWHSSPRWHQMILGSWYACPWIFPSYIEWTHLCNQGHCGKVEYVFQGKSPRELWLLLCALSRGSPLPYHQMFKEPCGEVHRMESWSSLPTGSINLPVTWISPLASTSSSLRQVFKSLSHRNWMFITVPCRLKPLRFGVINSLWRDR